MELSALTNRNSHLLRQLGIVSATALVISNMVGTGIFTATGFLAGPLGSPALVISIWIVGAVCALAGAFCYSELGINFPSSGGEYVYLTQAFGPTWGFMTGWVSFFAGFSAPIAAAALACSDYLGYFFPALQQSNAAFVLGSGTWQIKAGWSTVVACGIVAAFTLLNCLGIQRAARIQNVLTAGKVLVILSFILAGLFWGEGNWHHFAEPAVRTSTTPMVAQYAISLYFIYVSYSGWNAATYVAEELKHPAKTLPAALAWGTAAVAALYVGLNVVFIYSTPLEQTKGVVAIGSLAASRLFGPGVAGVFSAAMALSLLATVNAIVTVGPRVYYAMAKNGAFFSAAARVHPRWHTPVFALIAQCICTMVMTLTPFRDLLTYIGFTLNFFAVMSVASLFVFRRRPGWRRLKAVDIAWPVIPIFFILVGVWMTIFGITLEPRVSLAGVLTIGTGAAVYHFRRRREV
ncbi:MAG TPA: amino acid permease [Bryobacteraceae bacterium]|nr:amino acid permease [Bryobacteraceae bacterium]